uniref:Uncharacterized protein n=1 Tax=Oryza sativa subsp. japonica TaxID=39947 RepID=Q6ZL04_ORYSJ|nr:hypothetical protein [Oryza sativa Japonica Group]BAD30235.1 hypothetical protein [Oryza sativa Japonica Group]
MKAAQQRASYRSKAKPAKNPVLDQITTCQPESQMRCEWTLDSGDDDGVAPTLLPLPCLNKGKESHLISSPPDQLGPSQMLCFD